MWKWYKGLNIEFFWREQKRGEREEWGIPFNPLERECQSDAGLWLVGADHVTSILASDWSADMEALPPARALVLISTFDFSSDSPLPAPSSQSTACTFIDKNYKIFSLHCQSALFLPGIQWGIRSLSSPIRLEEVKTFSKLLNTRHKTSTREWHVSTSLHSRQPFLGYSPFLLRKKSTDI